MGLHWRKKARLKKTNKQRPSSWTEETEEQRKKEEETAFWSFRFLSPEIFTSHDSSTLRKHLALTFLAQNAWMSLTFRWVPKPLHLIQVSIYKRCKNSRCFKIQWQHGGEFISCCQCCITFEEVEDHCGSRSPLTALSAYFLLLSLLKHPKHTHSRLIPKIVNANRY